MISAATHLFAVLVCDDRAFSRTRICAEHDAISEYTPYDGGTGTGRLGQRQSFFRQKVIACPK